MLKRIEIFLLVCGLLRNVRALTARDHEHARCEQTLAAAAAAACAAAALLLRLRCCCG
jgi:hypothetical protein